MAGILDKKLRFIDFKVTQEGKRQIASGKLRAEYASLTDMHTFYSKAEHEGVSDRLFLEVMERPENMIVLEKDDSGNLIEFNFSPTGSINPKVRFSGGNEIFDKDATATSTLRLNPVTGSQFASTSEKLMRSCLTHFKGNSMIGTYFVNGSNEFELNKKDLRFAISNTVPFKHGPNSEVINVNDADPFFFDSKLMHLDNFMFLPPVNTDHTLENPSFYGSHEDPRQPLTRESLTQIKNHLGSLAFDNDNAKIEDIYKARQDKVGDFNVINRTKLEPFDTPLPKQYETIYFKKTSLENNLLIQIFEDSPDSKLTKLDVIDAGAFYDDEALDGRSEKRIFYVGKVYFDDFNVPTFINLFTLVLD